MAHSAIYKGKLVIVSDGGSVTGLGIRGFRTAVKQIEGSNRDLAESSKAMLAVYRDGIAMWDARTA